MDIASLGCRPGRRARGCFVNLPDDPHRNPLAAAALAWAATWSFALVIWLAMEVFG